MPQRVPFIPHHLDLFAITENTGKEGGEGGHTNHTQQAHNAALMLCTCCTRRPLWEGHNGCPGARYQMVHSCSPSSGLSRADVQSALAVRQQLPSRPEPGEEALQHLSLLKEDEDEGQAGDSSLCLSTLYLQLSSNYSRNSQIKMSVTVSIQTFITIEADEKQVPYKVQKGRGYISTA